METFCCHLIFGCSLKAQNRSNIVLLHCYFIFYSATIVAEKSRPLHWVLFFPSHREWTVQSVQTLNFLIFRWFSNSPETGTRNSLPSVIRKKWKDICPIIFFGVVTFSCIVCRTREYLFKILRSLGQYFPQKKNVIQPIFLSDELKFSNKWNFNSGFFGPHKWRRLGAIPILFLFHFQVKVAYVLRVLVHQEGAVVSCVELPGVFQPLRVASIPEKLRHSCLPIAHCQSLDQHFSRRLLLSSQPFK